MTIDINCDMGERADIDEQAIIPWITSANVACGGHAGDEAMMERTLELAHRHGVEVGAHPGYPDPANFGREEMSLSDLELADSLFGQLSRLAAVAARIGLPITYVKPHGALYNVAARRAGTAAAIAAGVARWRCDVVLVGLARSPMLDVWRAAGFQVAAEGFADRAYEADGTLRSRKLPGALLTDPVEAAEHALRLAQSGTVDTLCVHSDTSGAAAIVQAVRETLEGKGIRVSPFVHA
jgi:5-oxoprolinase (ATP-hydrolysing) subunit A